jgi:two-component system, OmpR family, phosphate regulon sensor histidine kinase PhoR
MRPKSLITRAYVIVVGTLLLGQAAALTVALNSANGALNVSIAVGIVMVISLGVVSYLFLGIKRYFRTIDTLAREATSKKQGVILTAPVWEESSGIVELSNFLTSKLNEHFQRESVQLSQERAILTSMIEGVLAIDTQGRISNMNDAAAELFQISVDHALGRRIEEVVRISSVLDFIQHIFDEKKPVIRNLQLYGEKERFLRAHGNRLIGTNSEEIGALVVLFDITRMHQLEMVRREFAANVSHELKTPITGIKGFVETLLDGPPQRPEELKRYLTIISQQTDRLASIIDDLLELARIEQDVERENITRVHAPILPVIEAAVSAYEEPVGKKSISINVSCDEHLSAEFNTQLLEQAVGNLLDNAVKYSDFNGSIEIDARKKENDIIITVNDYGCGIEEQHLPRLFERFYRVDKARSRELGGTGLGLAIVKHIALSHRGEAEVSSTPGTGSTFTVHFPARA